MSPGIGHMEGGFTEGPVERDARNTTAVCIMLALAHVTTKPGLKRGCYLAAGRHLAMLRKGRSKADWADIVQRECPVSVSRAYELMAIADGTKPVETLRMSTRVRRRKHYRNKGIKESGKAKRLP